jgi:hypothetical protein
MNTRTPMDTATPTTAKRRMPPDSLSAGHILPAEPPRKPGYNPAAAFPGSSIGRASGC